MGKFIFGLLMGIIIGAGGLWYFQQQQAGALAGNQNQTITDAKAVMNAKLDALELQTDRIQKELKEKGRVVRRKASQFGAEVVNAATDAALTATIKGKLVADPKLSAWDISVSTSDGVVTLSGTVSEPALIGSAILMALETDGVNQVISTIKVE